VVLFSQSEVNAKALDWASGILKVGCIPSFSCLFWEAYFCADKLLPPMPDP
jgi:hypothetical protein